METFLGIIILGLFINFLSNRIEANLPKASRWLANLAASLMPKEDRERLKEEWLAYVEDLSGHSKLWQALQLPYAAAASVIEKISSKWVQSISLVLFFFVPPYAYKVRFLSAVVTCVSIKCAYPIYNTLGLEKIDSNRAVPRFCLITTVRAVGNLLSSTVDMLSDPKIECALADRQKLKVAGNELLSAVDELLTEKLTGISHQIQGKDKIV